MDKEHPTQGKSQTSTPRTLKHQQRSQLLLQVVERAALSDPALRQHLAEAMADTLADDPALADAFNALFRPAVPGPPVLLATSALVTGVLNTQSRVLNTATRSGAGSKPTTSKPSPSPRFSPPTPLSPTPSLPSSPPSGGTSPSPASPARQRDALIDAWADVFGEGDYRNLSDREMGQCLKANVKLRNMAQRTDRTVEDMAAGIRTAARNWPNVMTGNRTMSIALIVDNWGALVHGPQTRGRSNGIVHTQYLNESGTIKREESFSQMAARKGRRD